MSAQHEQPSVSPDFRSDDEEVFYSDDRGSLRGVIKTRIQDCPLELKERTKEEFVGAYQYAIDLLGTNPFSRDGWELHLNPGGGFGASGTFMNIPKDWIEAIDDRPRLTAFVRSMFVHELMHHFRDEEDVAMFAELVYLAEYQQGWRIDEIQEMYVQPEKHPEFDQRYISGYESIARALGVEARSIAYMLRDISLSELKSAFRKFVQSIHVTKMSPATPWGT